MHTGPFPMRLSDNDNEPRATYWPADEVVACPSDDSDCAPLSEREEYELAAWSLRCDGDPSADRCVS